jgi:hypothetical protein
MGYSIHSRQVPMDRPAVRAQSVDNDRDLIRIRQILAVDTSVMVGDGW